MNCSLILMRNNEFQQKNLIPFVKRGGGSVIIGLVVVGAMNHL